MDLAWMAWTPATIIFYVAIGVSLATLSFLAVRYPETERVGVLRIPTTRGDRFFISLLGSAFIHLAFIPLFGVDALATLPVGDGLEISRLWIASGISLLWAIAVFRWV
jgi:predicted small integral membrane protein